MKRNEIEFSDIVNSKGMEYINRAYLRTHTLNIFTKNTELLVSNLRDLSDPEAHIKSISKDNGECDRQALRDIICLAHNFLAGAMTLVDHTRVFVKDYYLGTKVNIEYRERLIKAFSENGTSRFIQDLRNYMVHRGPVPLSRTLNLKRVEGGKPGQATATTGFYLSKEKLLIWDGWKSDSKSFLKNSAQNINLLPLVESYRDMIYKFHDDLDDLIREYHKNDLEILLEMEKTFEEQERVRDQNR